ncbi:MAG: Tfp pilus assembly protein PilF [Acidobacteria bacterium]|nr:Tfp pilus assembly protein PilF [Acidobacteriota bacterium]
MKRLTLLLAATLCLLLIASTGPAVSAKETWTSVRSKNFLLVGNASEKEIRQVAVRLEQFREVASRLFVKANFNSPVPTTVVVFKNDSSYRPFKPNANTAGYFQAGPDVNYITLKTEVNDDQNPFGVIFHEYTHLLINNTNGNVPTWFNEGLAEYYSTFSITDDRKVVLGKPIANHVYLLRENKMLPLRTLFKVDQESAYYNERDKQSIFYAESWALMHYLIGNNKGERLEQLGKFIQLLDNNMAMEPAFQQAFQTSFENMEKALREYIKRDSYPITSGHFETKLALDTEMQAAPISEAEAQAYLGDLLLHSHRAEAEGYLQKALALDPDLAMANAAMGMLLVRQGKIVEARQSLERAVAANSKNYLIHYYYAFALSREGMNENKLVMGYSPETAAKILEEVKKAIDLRPDFPESYNLLAFVNLVTGTQLDESITLLKRVLATSPGRNDLLFTLAQIYIRKEDIKTARQILERLSQNNSDQHLRQQSQGILKQLAEREEQIARFEAMRKSSENANDSDASRYVVGASGTEANGPPPDPASYLRDALRVPGEGEKRIQGSLVRIDCDAKGITFVVKVDDRLVKLHTEKFQNVKMTAFSVDAGMEVTCGPRKIESSVIICYLPLTDPKAKFEGTIRSVEFVPKDFKLKA